MLGIFVFRSFDAGFFVCFKQFFQYCSFQTNAIYLYLAEHTISQYLVLSLYYEHTYFLVLLSLLPAMKTQENSINMF